ncbi:MAG: EamA family transporter, partial [Nitrospinaceae bacterium]|nr:EamA family transporter [Nitrospinaceae bacterium]
AGMGIFGPGIGSICRMMGVMRMGLSPSTLVASSTPIWGTMLAIFILGEEPTTRVLIGTVFIVGGVSLLAFEDRDEESRNFRNWFRTALIFPVVASVAYAVAPIFIKLAYAYQKTPMLGLGVGFCVGNILLLLAKPILPGGGRIHAPLKSIAWYLLGGTFNFTAAICFMTALTFGNLSSILPVSRLTPLWVVFFSSIFLRKLERITGLIILAAALVVAGGVMISIR